MAKLFWIYGTMDSEKTIQALVVAHNYEQHGGRVLMTKPAADTKGDRNLVSRIGLSREVDFLATPDMDMTAEVLRRQEEIEKINAVLVDEAQFLDPSQVDQLLALAVVHSIPVMAWGCVPILGRRAFRQRGNDLHRFSHSSLLIMYLNRRRHRRVYTIF